MQQPINLLERYWHYTSFKPLQEEIISSVLEGNDVFTLLPTGGGKSICFQIPALVKDGICVVISPLVALMKDQVKALNEKGIKAVALTSGITYKDLDQLLDNCIYGNYKFLYLSPERLQQELVKDRIRQMNVNLIAIDEAHCISQWGNDFRPPYKLIKVLRDIHPQVNWVALTASAKPKVVDDIIDELEFVKPQVFKQSFFRENLAYMVLNEADKYYRIESILKKYKSSSIIYVRNRKLTIDISNHLEKHDISAAAFHGGLSNTEKEERLNQWLNNQKQVMVATNAFGMGIDKPDVKTVIHFNLPESIESYFQEAGRAGRNGERAFAIILKNENDELLIKNQFLKNLPSVEFIKLMYRKLCNYFQISYGEGENSIHDFNFNQYCKAYKFNSILAYNALQILDRTSVINLSQQFNKRTSLQFIVSNNILFNYLEENLEKQLIVKTILRTYGGIFEHNINVNTTLISEKSGFTEKVINNALLSLKKDNIIDLKQSKYDAQITFIQPREDDKTINRIASIVDQQNELKQNQVQAILDYSNNNDICKSEQLLNYFGETHTEPCGICSVCIKKNNHKETNAKTISIDILNQLKKGDLSSREITSILSSYTELEIIESLQLLLEHNKITITSNNTYTLCLN